MADLLVKDWLTGEKAPRSTLWRNPKDKHYYTSEAAYNAMVAEKERVSSIRRECLDTVLTLLGLPLNGMPPKELVRDLKLLYDGYGIDAYRRVIMKKKDYLADIFSKKDFYNERAKQRYLLAVLSNSIADERDYVRREKAISRSFDRIPDVDEGYLDVVGTTKKFRDVSEF